MRARVLLPVAWLVLAGGLWAHARGYDFVTDDAYISFRYADNLVRHGALEYNPGERVEGYTNFLWTVTLAGLLALGWAPESASLALGALCGAAGMALSWRLARRSLPDPHALLAPALCALLPAYACWSSGGLETQMFTALAAGGLLALLSGRDLAAGALYAAALATRPEGALLFLLAAAADFAVTRRARWRLYAAFAVPAAAFFLWRWSYYRDLLPNTFYVKAGAGPAWERGARYLATFATDNPVWAACAAAALLQRRDRALRAVTALTVPVWCAYLASVGGDFMALHRFLVPLVPPCAAGAACALAGAIARRPRLWPLAPALLALLAFGAARAGRATLARRDAIDGVDSIGYLKKFAEDRVRVGRWMRDHLPPDTLVSVGGAGALPYASRLPVLDAFGLTDRRVARGRAVSDRPGHQKVAPLSYLLERGVEVACFPQDATLLRRGFSRVCFPVDVTPRYCCLSRVPIPGT